MQSNRQFLYASFAAGFITLAMKTVAWWLTGSVSLYSDALESLVNLAAAAAGFWALTIVARPADSDHHFGHDKAAYFASGLEGGLIAFAALAISWAAIARLLAPQALGDLGVGLLLSLAASVVNGVVGFWLLRHGRRLDNIVLEADGQHLLTDVWTSVGIVAGLFVATLLPPQYAWLDPVLALLVAANILFAAWGLVRRSLDGLMDKSLPEEDATRIRAAIASAAPLATLLSLKTRKSGSMRFAEVTLALPPATSLAECHALCDTVEAALARQFAPIQTVVHVEPLAMP